MAVDPVANYVITDHARLEMSRRGLSDEIIHATLSAPEQRCAVRPGRVVLQSRLAFGESATMGLVRVFVDIVRSPAEVVTA